MSQLALSVVLLVGATLFVRSLLLARAPTSASTRSRAMMSVNVGLQGYDEARGRRFYDDVLARVRALPAVAAAGFTFPVPFDTYGRSRRCTSTDASSADDGHRTRTSYRPTFRRGARAALAAGRGFTTADSAGAPLVMVVSRSLAARLWPERPRSDSVRARGA